MLVAEHFSSNGELISFIGEFFLAENSENDRAAEVLLKNLLKKRQIRSVDDFDFLILILFLGSSSRAVRSSALKIFARKWSITKGHLEPIKKLVETHENEILAGAQFLSRIFQFYFQSNKLTEKKKRKLNDEHFPVVQILEKTIEDQTSIDERFQQKLKIELLRIFKTSPHPTIFQSFGPIFENPLSQNEKIIQKESNRILLELIIDQINALVLRFFKQVRRSRKNELFEIRFFLFVFSFRRKFSTLSGINSKNKFSCSNIVFRFTNVQIRPIFNFLEKTFNETNDEQSYIQQLCLTALTNIYNNLTPGLSLNLTEIHQEAIRQFCFCSFSEKCNADSLKNETVIECLKRTTGWFCFWFRNKTRNEYFFFQEKLITMMMEMFAFVGDRLVRKDDFYSY